MTLGPEARYVLRGDLRTLLVCNVRYALLVQIPRVASLAHAVVQKHGPVLDQATREQLADEIRDREHFRDLGEAKRWQAFADWLVKGDP